jgi:DNA-binding winged helix-turn-helix (wHTH) protein
MAGSPLIAPHDFHVGPIHVRPAARAIESSKGSFVTEPLVMQLLVELSQKAGRVVTRREIFESCWGLAPVGDDSLNRVVAALRKVLAMADGETVMVETVSGAGYSLRLRARGEAQLGDVKHAIEEGIDSVRFGLSAPDYLRLEMLRRANAIDPDSAAAWGMRALLCRYAAEYAGPESSGEYLTECEFSGARALALDPAQGEARVALATVAPLFGRWLQARTALEAVIAGDADCMAARHELAIVEMTTGRVGEAKRLMDRLIAVDPLAACFNYKSIWQHWSIGDLAGMDHTADRAIQLWPTHPAVWTARLWTLAHTGRARAALAMLDDAAARPLIPAPMFRVLQMVMRAAATREQAAVEEAVQACRTAAERGPAQAVAALLALGLFDAVDEAFEVAYAYYARAGDSPVPVRHMAGDASINDQHRRVTQPLFTPACASLRSDPRFAVLCERIGLTAYWNESGLQPDYQQAG